MNYILLLVVAYIYDFDLYMIILYPSLFIIYFVIDFIAFEGIHQVICK